jgi:predicted outer membrane protein
MSASLRLRFGAVAAGLTCLLLSYAVAQQDTAIDKTPLDANASGQTDRATTQQTDPSATPTAERAVREFDRNRTNYREAQAAAGGQNPMVDHFLANCLLAKNKGEVELSEIAVQKSENAEVKQFAQKMIQDHNKLIEQLQPLAAMQRGAKRGASIESRTGDTTALPGSSGARETISPSGTSTDVPPAAVTTETTITTNATKTAAGGNAVHQLMQIERKINERCLQMAKDELQQKSGVEFDKCYVGNAIGAHAHALAALEVIGKQGQGQLAQVAQQAQPTVQHHFDHAKQLMKQLETQSNAAGTQAQRESNRTE